LRKEVILPVKIYTTSHLIRPEYLNHHGTLYAGKSVDWMVEAAFSAVAQEHGIPDELVCLKIEEMTFKQPVEAGDILIISATVARASGSSIVMHVESTSQMSRVSCVEGYITFVTWDSQTRTSKPHRICLDEAADARESEIRARAAKFKHKQS